MTALDASALLAFLFREDGHEPVAGVIDRACMSAVNLAEVLGRYARDGHGVEEARRRIALTSLEIVPFGTAEAEAAASLVPRTRALGLSLGDRACLALALARRIPAMTADRTWSRLHPGVPIRVIRS
jgi:PIN domain nuclease of toxin-antitoxin system